MKKVFLILIFVILGSKTTYSQDYFTIVQKESNLPIKIGADTTTNWVYKVGFPLVFELTYHPSDTMRFVLSDYLSNPTYSRSLNIWLSNGLTLNYDNYDKITMRSGDDARIFDKETNTHTYVYYTGHAPSNDSLLQVVFAPYVQRMREQKKAVIEIESIQELKAKNADLTNTFLIGDSIRFLFRNKDGFYEQTIPVEVK